MTPEGKIKDRIKQFLSSLGADCWFYCPVPMGYGRKGIPDFLGCYKGRFFSIETKTKTGKVSPWQQRENDAIGDARGTYWVLGPQFGAEACIADFCKKFEINYYDAI